MIIKRFKLFCESINNDLLDDMRVFGLSTDDIDEKGYVTLYHGGVKLPKIINDDQIFFVTPDIELAKDYARIRKGKVFTLKVKADDVRWNTGTNEVEFDKGGKIINGIIIPNIKVDKNPSNAVLSTDKWSTKKNYREITEYENIKRGDKLKKSKRIVHDILQFKDGKVQFKLDDNNWHLANTLLAYENTN